MSRITAAAVGVTLAATVGAAAGCNPLGYGCHNSKRAGVHCINTNHNPNAAAVYPAGRALHQPIKPPVLTG